MLVARRSVFFDFNLKTKALILAALELRWPAYEATKNGGNGSLSTKSPILSPRPGMCVLSNSVEN